MDQYLNNRQNEILWKLLANPADNGHMYGSNLQQLAADFPQSGLLRAMLARAAGAEAIPHAAASFSPKALYVMMNAYENLAEVSEGQIVQQLNGSINYAGGHSRGGLDEDIADKVVIGTDEAHEVENMAFEREIEPSVNEETEIEHQDEPEQLIELQEEEIIPEPILAESQEEPVAEMEELNPELVQITEMPEEDYRAEMHRPVFDEEIIEFDERSEEGPVEQVEESPAVIEAITEIPTEGKGAEIELPVFEEETTESPLVNDAIIEGEDEIENIPSEASKDIDDEIFDEIVGIESISFASAKKPVEEFMQSEIAAGLEVPKLPETVGEPTSEGTEAEVIVDESQEALAELIPDHIAATNYFVFEQAGQNDVKPEITETETLVAAQEMVNGPTTEYTTIEAETNDISKYHDEKMPYTFMWWLDKTRKEHASVYQPFKLDTTQVIKHTADETLQQQYYENIFHITTIAELDRDAAKQTIEFDMKNKEDRIIKKFITEDPHISTPSGDKLDNENKAKKSAEDQDELVTETLARIYVDQMLYHKAINTYKKLMLKFPEKSRYFADQIQVLERKIN